MTLDKYIMCVVMLKGSVWCNLIDKKIKVCMGIAQKSFWESEREVGVH